MVRVKKYWYIMFTVMLLLIIMNAPASTLATQMQNNINPEETYSRVVKLGIMENKGAEASLDKKYIRRDEFSKILVMLSGADNKAVIARHESVFGDVKSNSKYGTYIKIVLEKGYLSGMVDGKFHPEQYVTYAEACTAFVKILGYGDSDLNGVWPDNYLQKVEDLKIITGLTFSINDKLSQSNCAVMIERLLNTNVKKNSNQDADKTLAAYNGLYSDIIILGNSSTLKTLADNEVLTNIGTYHIESGISIKIGHKYRLMVDNNKYITKMYYELDDTKDISVTSINGDVANYLENGNVQKLILRSDITYFHNGTKQDFDIIKNSIQADSLLIYTNNSENNETGYAILLDPIYSKPQIASKVKVNSAGAGSITFSNKEPIVKNGQYITAADISDGDVVYEVSDFNNNGKYISVVDNKVEGKLTGVLPNRLSPRTIQIDNKNYDISNDMDTTGIIKEKSDFKIGDNVQISLGYDNLAVSLSKNVFVGKNVDAIVLGNITTMKSLTANQIMTDQGMFYLMDQSSKLTIGKKYRFFVGNNKIQKVLASLNDVKNLISYSAIGSKVYYRFNGKEASLVLPENIDYYYQGVKQAYGMLKDIIKTDSTMILSKNTEGTGYEYGVIVDPKYSKPLIITSTSITKNKIGNFELKSGERIIKNGDNISINDIQTDDVVYQVSDIAGIDKYLCVVDNKIEGKLTAIVPSRLNATALQLDDKLYDISSDMDLSKITSDYSKYKLSDTMQILLGYDNKIVDVSKTSVVGQNIDCIILGDSSTDNSISKEQILTDKGILTLSNSKFNIELGSKYTLFVHNNTILKKIKQISKATGLSIVNMNGDQITYDDNGKNNQLELADNFTYYYNGEKISFDNAKKLIQVYSTVFLAPSDNNKGYAYAVVFDPIYSKPQISQGSLAGVHKIGDIDIVDGENVVKNGDFINSGDIKKDDVIYQISDVLNKHKYLYVVDNKIEGRLTAILPNRISPKIIQLDNKNYDLSTDMDLSKLQELNSSYKIGDTIQAFFGSDNKIVALSTNSIVGQNLDCVILATPDVENSLKYNQILTDNGVFNLADLSLRLNIGCKYTLYIHNKTVLSCIKTINQTNNVVVDNVYDSQISYTKDGVSNLMILPIDTVYYYKGAKQNSDYIKSILKGDSTILFSNDTGGTGSDYAVVFDPVHSDPYVVANYPIHNSAGSITIGSYTIDPLTTPIVKNGDYIYYYNITTGQVVYEVSDIMRTNKYIEVVDNKVTGKLTAILPNRLHPAALQIDGTTFDLSSSFDSGFLSNRSTWQYYSSLIKVGSNITVTLGYDGKIVKVIGQ